jgi:hypothetical protein
MSEPAPGTDPPPLVARFVSSVWDGFGHDLRAKIGTVVNFAALLEEGATADAAAARELAARVREHALEAAGMWTVLVDAMNAAAASGARSIERGDPAELLRAIAAEIDVAPALTSTPAKVEVEFHRPPVAFALRAFLELERSVRSSPLEVDLRVEHGDGGPSIEVRCGRDGVDRAPVATVEAFLHSSRARIRSARSCALRLAAALVEQSGGAVEFGGRPGEGAWMRLLRSARRGSR